MKAIEILNVLIFTATAFMLLYYFFTIRKKDNIEGTRDHLFSIREDFFEQARELELDFNSPAYRLVEDNINRTIRFIHRASFTTVVLAFFQPKKELEAVKKSMDTSLNKTVKPLNKKQKDLCLRTMNKLHVRLGIHIACDSIFMKALFYSLVIVFVIKASGKITFKKQQKKIARYKIFDAITNKSEALANCYS